MSVVVTRLEHLMWGYQGSEEAVVLVVGKVVAIYGDKASVSVVPVRVSV